MSAGLTQVPRWLELQAEIDYRLFLLAEIQRDEDRLTPVGRMVDAATGHDEARRVEAEKIIAEIRALKVERDTLGQEQQQ